MPSKIVRGKVVRRAVKWVGRAESGEDDTADVNVVPSGMEVDADEGTSVPADMKIVAAETMTLSYARE